jgi:hypothetical protein
MLWKGRIGETPEFVIGGSKATDDAWLEAQVVQMETIRDVIKGITPKIKPADMKEAVHAHGLLEDAIELALCRCQNAAE